MLFLGLFIIAFIIVFSFVFTFRIVYSLLILSHHVLYLCHDCLLVLCVYCHMFYSIPFAVSSWYWRLDCFGFPFCLLSIYCPFSDHLISNCFWNKGIRSTSSRSASGSLSDSSQKIFSNSQIYNRRGLLGLRHHTVEHGWAPVSDWIQTEPGLWTAC